MTLTGTSTDIFIFRVKSALTTFTGSTVTLSGGVNACNVFWQVPSQATLANDVLNFPFVGNVVAGTTVALSPSANLVGRALAFTAAVTLAGKNTVGGCSGGTVNVIKNTGATTDNGTFSFTGDLGPFSITTAGGTFTKTFTNVPPGPLSIAETGQIGWTLGTNGCFTVVVPQAGDEPVTCTVTNKKDVVTPVPGTLIVKKISVGGSGIFNFTGTGVIGPFNIDTTTTNSNQQTFSGLAPGPYTITETGLPAGTWNTTYSSNCQPATVPPGGTATCTVTNTKVPPTPHLSLVKTANPMTYTGAGQLITYTYVVKNTGNTTLNGPFTVTDNKLGTFPCGPINQVLLPGASFSCTHTYLTKPSDLGTASLPTNVTANIDTGAWLAFVNSTQDTTITGAPGVPNGVYPCWCIQDHVSRDLHNEPAKLFSTIGGSLPADVAGLAWKKINYVLNHKIHGVGRSNLEFLEDVQTAIWVLLGEPDPEFGISTFAQQMIDAANLNPSFVPGSGEIVAVIVYSDGMTIRPNSIQESICEMKPLKTIVNKATVRNRVVRSNQAQATVNQIKKP